jgi:hypothetical protein
VPGVNDFSTGIPLEALRQLAQLGRDFGIDPLGSAELERFLLEMLKHRTVEEIATDVIPKAFWCVKTRPVWLQGADWPVLQGRPMVFVGQIDTPGGSAHLPDRTLDRGTSFYVFWDPETGITRVVVQTE